MSKQEVTTTEKANNLPAHLQGGRKAKVGNIDTSDMIIPRVKLLQAISPEVEAKMPGAETGVFWHTIAQQPLGATLRGIPLLIKKSHVLWSPRNDDRGILARASDGVHWDRGFENMSFEVKPKGSPHKITYNTGDNVKASGLAEFGSSIPGDPQSPPALALTYTMLWFFPDFDYLSPAVIINTRSSVKPAKALISNLDMSPVDHYGRYFLVGTTDEKGDEGPYKGYSYRGDGFVEDPDLYARMEQLFHQFSEVEWKANDEQEESAGSSGASKPQGEVSSKF